MCDSKELLVGYLYDEIDGSAKRAFEKHLATCVECRDELTELGATRAQIALWTPPDSDLGFRIVRGASAPRASAFLDSHRRGGLRQRPFCCWHSALRSPISRCGMAAMVWSSAPVGIMRLAAAGGRIGSNPPWLEGSGRSTRSSGFASWNAPCQPIRSRRRFSMHPHRTCPTRRCSSACAKCSVKARRVSSAPSRHGLRT